MTKPKTLKEAQDNLSKAMVEFVQAFIQTVLPLAREWQKQGWLDENMKPTQKLKDAQAQLDKKEK